MSDSNLGFAEVASALSRVNATMEAAECHGTLSGLLCVRPTLQISEWLSETQPELAQALVSGDALARESRETLQTLFQETRAELESDEYIFHPILPDDTRPLSERLQQLGLWVQGFLFGLGLAGIQDFGALPGELPEWLHDMTEISRVDDYEVSGNEDDEHSYFDLVEYVRMGVMMCQSELRDLKQPHDPGTLH